ncbi:methylated-DNA--[protein]-cysteine S-methyltransferase [Rheinheimera sp.]|uniref:methylated-DNA--[protein]-cysteine S-methyltransferase n=1 Tax=Rheinheimera sp. TaxID=1869214 RepID=UPI0027BACE40|nr:methylated-DNA--[protein]-cysteine S-methyltransferase [Rheinheimera sp.]
MTNQQNNVQLRAQLQTQLQTTMATPVGELCVVATEQGISQIQFSDELPAHLVDITAKQLAPIRDGALAEMPIQQAMVAEGTLNPEQRAELYLQQAVSELQQYFAGTRSSFSVPLAATGTLFQQQVWQALQHIPYAQSCSYGAIASFIHKPKAVRAVGAANGRNPLAIVVPCHRVIGNNGSLTGYAGGLGRKVWLLQHEQQMQQQITAAHQ